MSLFTVIIGSAYGDASEGIYLVDTADAKSACVYAKRIAEAHRGMTLSALICIEGQAKFCPTMFDMPDGGDGYVPDVIDLRPPPAPKVTRFATAKVTNKEGDKAMKFLNDRSLLAKVNLEPGADKERLNTLSLLVPLSMPDDKAVSAICAAVGDEIEVTFNSVTEAV